MYTSQIYSLCRRGTATGLAVTIQKRPEAHADIIFFELEYDYDCDYLMPASYLLLVCHMRTGITSTFHNYYSTIYSVHSSPLLSIQYN